MNIINLRNLGVTFAITLFSRLNLTVSAGDRIGVVAANGRGKSTLIKCIAGIVDPTEGEITRARGLTIGMVEQNVPLSLMEMTFRDAVLQSLSSEKIATESWRGDVALEEWNVPLELRDRPLKALSGGWQRLALIAKTWVGEPDLLLLDEPTNHLDLAKIALLENWINGLPRDFPVILASHDRAFLDAVTNRTLFLRPQNSQDFALPYRRARIALDHADAADSKRYEKDMKTADQLRRQAAKLKNIGVNSGSDLLVVKTKQLKDRAEKLEAKAIPAHLERSAGKIQLSNRSTHAKVLVTLDNVNVTTPDGTHLFNTGKRFICQGDRIVLLGRNGVGKTRLITLLRKVIVDPSVELEGIKATPSLVLGYGDQTLAELDNRQSPHETVTHRFEIGDQRARTLLAGVGISVEMQGRPVAQLSGGQKARLGLLVLRLLEPNFYLLDEPTNHLDIEGQETLENELMEHHTSCLLVSHDRSFVRSTGNRFWLIEDRKLKEIESPEPFFEAV